MTNPPPLLRWVAGLLAAGGLAAILGLTLFPNPNQAPYAALTPLFCVVCGEQGGADVALNVLLFIPCATGLRLLGWSWRRVVLTSALLSFTVELLQYTVIIGRDASLSDLLTNTTGGMIGATLAPHLGKLSAPDPGLARRLFSLAVVFWLAILSLSALALRPWMRHGAVRSECTRSGDKADVYAGTARSVVLNGMALPCDQRIRPARTVREWLGRGDISLSVMALSHDPDKGRALIHTLSVPRGFVLVLAQHGRAAAFSAPTASLRLKLYAPILRLPDGFPPSAGIPVQLQAKTHARRLTLRSTYAGETRGVELTLSPAYGWTALLPWGIEGALPLRLVTAAWVAFLILPAGYWGSRVRRPGRVLAITVATLGAGLALLPWLTGYPPVHWSEWLGAGVGLALGWALHRIATYLQSRCGSPSTSAYS